MKSFYKISIFFILICFFSISCVNAETKEYRPITTGAEGTGLIGSTNAIESVGTFVKGAFRLGIAAAIILSVIMIILGGLQTMTTDSVFKKEEGMNKVKSAIYGLLLALCTIAILATINPKIVEFKLDFGKTTVVVKPIDVLSDQEYASKLMKEGYTAEEAQAMARSGNRNILELIKNGTILNVRGFTPEQNAALNAYALDQINKSGLLGLNPIDADKYFPNGITAEGYLNLISSMAYRESGFKPNTMYWEKDMTVPKYSVGLLQLSYDDLEVKRLGYSQEDLKDPYKNIQAGIMILERTIKKGNVISGGKNKGASAYWSTLW